MWSSSGNRNSASRNGLCCDDQCHLKRRQGDTVRTSRGSALTPHLHRSSSYSLVTQEIYSGSHQPPSLSSISSSRWLCPPSQSQIGFSSARALHGLAETSPWPSRDRPIQAKTQPRGSGSAQRAFSLRYVHVKNFIIAIKTAASFGRTEKCRGKRRVGRWNCQERDWTHMCMMRCRTDWP